MVVPFVSLIIMLTCRRALKYSLGRIILSFFAMWDYNRLNKQKIALCEREGITDSRREDFKDMGSESPLFRCALCFSVDFLLLIENLDIALLSKGLVVSSSF